MAKAEREKKLRALLDFALSLGARFEAGRDERLIFDLQTHINGLPLKFSDSVLAPRQEELDRIGTELWNLSTRLRYDNAQPNEMQALCLLRAFSFSILDTASGEAIYTGGSKHCIRLMKVALKAARVCIDNDELVSATKVLERAADYQQILEKEKVDERRDISASRDDISVNYFGLRVMLAWRHNRMDTAEHMFTKIKKMHSSIEPSTAEKLADMIYEMGKDALSKQTYELAVRWLERAHDFLGEHDIESQSIEARELRQIIMQTLVKSYMSISSPDMEKRAWDLMSLLETNYAEKMSVSLLKLELLASAHPIDVGQYHTVLIRMIRSVVLNDTNFKTIMYHVHKLKDSCNATASKVLNHLIDLRLFREESQDWLEKALITQIWIDISSSSDRNSLELLRSLFDNFAQNMKHPISAPATHAAQMLLWKRVETTYSQDHYVESESWCRICLHPIFEKAGEMNKSKIARKIMLCALSRQDYVAARETFGKMSDIGRDEPVTRYLLYRAALHTDDLDLLSECLEIVCCKSHKDTTLLYACVLEAQSSGNKRQAILALEKVLNKYDYNVPTGVHLPALLRCTARLLFSQITQNGKLDTVMVDEISKIFKGASTRAKTLRKRSITPHEQPFTPSDLEWFSKNAYNLALKFCAEMRPDHLVVMLNACTEFIVLLQDSRPADTPDLNLRLMFCDFLSTCALTTLARTEDNTQDCLQYYLQAQQHSKKFRLNAAEQLQSEVLQESARKDLVAKHHQLIKLELEALLKLRKWEDLEELLQECWKYQDPEHYGTLADLILVIYDCIQKEDVGSKYHDAIFTVLQKIINLTWRQNKTDIAQLSRWIRCLFQLALNCNEAVSLKCLDHAAQIAARGYGVSVDLPDPCASLETPPLSSPYKAAYNREKESSRYPGVELEWLATTSFNRAVDYYVQENDEKCQVWAENALSLSHWAEDGGALEKLLRDKYTGLSWE
ncbi:meiosis protein SPO22/ZIP4 like-domain-containing protein [Dendryphion nanum]|uniref:Meiosis protein SPO22/ZIP4 like-domain-containing protein n=1 Tax=Dendryphion nanum TaxID=256645 RepID=A0A9P9IK13_9PLEO|nr:meiosis protein SPO22/ZIP4 like-domain-containing protein [Dendryphion nanum]